MLLSLHIRDFVIVDRADIYFEAGFTVFSGETGAGKSILIDALALTLGQRGEAHFIRDGAQKTDVSAIFTVNPMATAWLIEQELESEELVLRRVIDQSGKSKAWINGTPATLAQLRAIAELLIDIHGQHAHQLLLKASAQRSLLDAHGNHADLLKSVQLHFKRWQQAQTALQQASLNSEQQQVVRERLEWQLAELAALNPARDEWAQVNSEYNRLAHASALIEAAGATLNSLDSEEFSIISLLNQAVHRMAQQLPKDSTLQSVYESLESARISCAEAASDLATYLDRLELDPQRLEQTEQRMRAMFDLANKFKLEPDDLYRQRLHLEQELETLNKSVDLKALQHSLDQEQATYFALAEKLSLARASSAAILSKKVTQAMQTLAMQGGVFEIERQACPASAHGLENIQFNVAGHAGTTPRALAKVASGGELARISLALSVMANKADQVPTLIFDEVDSGIGGAVAEVVGKLLRELGQRHQVLCVTHLAQVAACAHHHFEVSKRQNDQHTLSHITPLDETQRVHEVARMLGGMVITETTKKHAQEMLERI